jgi:hypothetical protein
LPSVKSILYPEIGGFIERVFVVIISTSIFGIPENILGGFVLFLKNPLLRI